MKQECVNRRDFLKLGLAAGAATALATGFPRFSLANVKTVTLSDCLDMTPEAIAEHSRMVMVSMSIYDGYKNVYGFALDRDAVIASQLLHDLHKPWVFQWQASGESRTEQKLAGTGEHHPSTGACPPTSAWPRPAPTTTRDGKRMSRAR